MQEVILALLRLFRSQVLDLETSTWVSDLVTDRSRWLDAHDLFRRIRRRSLEASSRRKAAAGNPDDGKDSVRCAQYVFEELCLKSVYNETDTKWPFDPASSFSVAEFAIRLARALDAQVQDVLFVLTSQADPQEAYYRQVYHKNSRPPAATVSVTGRLASAEEVAKEFPSLEQFPASTPGPYECNMGEKIAGLLDLFRGVVPDATSIAIVFELANTHNRWSAGHALFDIIHPRMAAMRARDWVGFLQYEFELCCLRALYNATWHVHPFASGSPFWVAGAALHLATAVGVPEQSVVAVLAPDDSSQGLPAAT